MSASQHASRRGSFASDAPDESEEEYQRQIEALEDSIYRDELKLDFDVKKLEQTRNDERKALARFDLVQGSRLTIEACMEPLRIQMAQKRVALKVFNFSLS
jgi:hypothetical protein